VSFRARFSPPAVAVGALVNSRLPSFRSPERLPAALCRRGRRERRGTYFLAGWRLKLACGSELEIYKVLELKAEGSSYFLHVGERDVLFRALDHAYVGAMHLGEFAEPLLGNAAFVALLAHAVAELDEYLLVHTYIPSVGIANYRLYIL